MRRRSSPLLAVVLAATLAGCTSVASDAPGAAIYDNLCASCHGGDLQGGVGPPLGPGSNAAEQPDEFLETTVLRGRGSMPSFSSTLSEEQLERLVVFLRAEQEG